MSQELQRNTDPIPPHIPNGAPAASVGNPGQLQPTAACANPHSHATSQPVCRNGRFCHQTSGKASCFDSGSCTVMVRQQATSSCWALPQPPALLTSLGMSVGCCLPDAGSLGSGVPPTQGCTDLWGCCWSSKAAAACSDSPRLYRRRARTPGCLQMHSGTWG